MKLSIKIIAAIAFIVITLAACRKDGLVEAKITLDFPQNLSELDIYSGTMASLVPSSDYHLYELASPLFTDFAEKQRLIKLPAGTEMVMKGDGLPTFPEGTILVKTFYYFNNKTQPNQGTRIIETRILQKENNNWNIAVYLWDKSQTEAKLITSGYNTNVNWIDKDGAPRVISYHVPNIRECAACHNSSGTIEPIGPKLHNMNRDIIVSGNAKNQLQHFQELELFNSFDHESITALPSYGNINNVLEKRARAYLDINCAHCHNNYGIADNVGLLLNYEVPLNESGIKEKSDKIKKQLDSGSMPLVGTSLLDKEGIEMLTEYLNSL